MRHRKSGVKLNRTSSHKDAMFRNMITSLFKYERIRTTDVKAKELRRLADKMVTLAKRGDLHARRQALSVIREKEVVHKLFDMAPERFGKINGGYTRIMKMGLRPGDAAPMSIIELVDLAGDKPLKKKSKKAKKAAKTAGVAPGTAPTPSEEPKDSKEAAPVADETMAEPVATAGEVSAEAESAPDREEAAPQTEAAQPEVGQAEPAQPEAEQAAPEQAEETDPEAEKAQAAPAEAAPEPAAPEEGKPEPPAEGDGDKPKDA